MRQGSLSALVPGLGRRAVEQGPRCGPGPGSRVEEYWTVLDCIGLYWTVSTVQSRRMDLLGISCQWLSPGLGDPPLRSTSRRNPSPTIDSLDPIGAHRHDETKRCSLPLTRIKAWPWDTNGLTNGGGQSGVAMGFVSKRD